MRLLCLDTSTPVTTVALVSDGEVLGERSIEGVNAHGELLAPALAALLADHGRDYDGVACGTGPGPYTSLRVGIATAVALGRARGVPTWGACSLDLVGHGTAGRVVVAQDARRREVFWAAYDDGVRSSGPHVGPWDGVDVRGARVLGDPAVAPGAELCRPRAEVLWHLRGEPGPLSPTYLRAPDATPPVARPPRGPAAQR